MKLKSLIIVGLLTATSCTNQSEAFYIEKFYPLAPGCDGVTNVETMVAGNGYLDVAANSAQFFIGIRVGGAQNIQQNAVVLGSTTLERANRNQPLVNQMVVTYRLSKRVGAAPKPYLTNINLPFSDKGAIFGAFQLISPELATALYDGLTPPPGPAPSGVIEDFVDISADVEFKGEFSATKSPFSTGILTMPIRAYRSLPAPCSPGVGYLRFAPDQSTGAAPYDLCNYTGQTSTQTLAPSPPTCCVAKAPGC